VRLPKELIRRIERKAIEAGCDKGRIIVDALESYLRLNEQDGSRAEAGHQSRLAAALDLGDAEWDKMIERDFSRLFATRE
jgi:hypothetical protein